MWYAVRRYVMYTDAVDAANRLNPTLLRLGPRFNSVRFPPEPGWEPLLDDHDNGYSRFIAVTATGLPVLVIFGREPPDAALLSEFEVALASGEAVEASRTLLADLFTQWRLQDVEKRLPDGEHVFPPDADPEPDWRDAAFGGQAELDRFRTLVQRDDAARQALRARLVARGSPPVEVFRRSFAAWPTPHELSPAATYLCTQQTRKDLATCPAYRLTESARAMLRALVDLRPELTQEPLRPGVTWVEHDRPQRMVDTDLLGLVAYPAAAGTFAPLGPSDREVLSLFCQLTFVLAIDTEYHVRCALLFDSSGGANLSAHECRSGRCIYPVDQEVTLCAACEAFFHEFTDYSYYALAMVRRFFANSPIPKPFAQAEQAYKVEERNPHHGRHLPKTVLRDQRRRYYLVDYEVSERIELDDNDLDTDMDDLDGDEKADDATRRTSWLHMYGSEHIIYVQRDIPAYERRYPRRRDGARREGRVTVTHAEGKYVPMLATGVKRRIRRVVAKRYQQLANDNDVGR